MKKSFNLAEHIKGTSINEKLEEARSYFGDSLGNKAPREMNLDNDGKNKYSDPGTNMEKLVSEKHKGSPDKTMEEQMEPKRKNDVARGTTTAEDALDSKRNNDGMSYYMKTLEEHLNARRHSAE